MKSAQLTKGMLLKDSLQKQNKLNNKMCYGYNHILISSNGFRN